MCVVDATNLRLNLRLVLEARALNLPLVLVLNMSDAARHSGIRVDRALLAHELAMPVPWARSTHCLPPEKMWPHS